MVCRQLRRLSRQQKVELREMMWEDAATAIKKALGRQTPAELQDTQDTVRIDEELEGREVRVRASYQPESFGNQDEYEEIPRMAGRAAANVDQERDHPKLKCNPAERRRLKLEKDNGMSSKTVEDASPLSDKELRAAEAKLAKERSGRLKAMPSEGQLMDFMIAVEARSK